MKQSILAKEHFFATIIATAFFYYFGQQGHVCCCAHTLASQARTTWPTKHCRADHLRGRRDSTQAPLPTTQPATTKKHLLRWEPHTFVSLPPRANSYNVPFFLPQAFTLGPTQGKSAPVTLFFGVSVKVAIMTYKGRFGMFFNIGSALPTEANQASYP